MRAVTRKCAYCGKPMPESYGTIVDSEVWPWRVYRGGRHKVLCSRLCSMWWDYHSAVARHLDEHFVPSAVHT